MREVCRVLKMSSKTVSAISKGSYNPGKCGRPGSLSKEHIAFIEANSMMNARLTDSEITEMTNKHFNISVSRSTVCRIRQRLGFVYRPPRVMQDLTDDQIRMRIDFCQWVLSHPDEIPNIVFTDESRFQIGCDNAWRRMRRGQMDESCFQKKVKFPKGLMVWGGIGINYRTPLMICSTGVDSAEYTKILAQSDMLSEMNSRFGEAKWTLMQDGAPCHTARRTMNWAADNHVCLLPGWPPNSCDLNPIEQIWGIMKHQLRRKRQQSVEDMFTTLQATWYAISDQCINSLVSSFTQ